MSDLNHALFTGISPSALQAPSVSEARAALEAHEAACPGTHLDCYGDPAKERARQAWVDRKALLKSALDLAERCAGQGWREVSPGPAPQPGPQPISIPDPKDTPMPRSKTPEQKLDTMLARLRAYITQGKPKLASTLRSQIRAFCEREGIHCHVLPPNRGKGLGAPEPEAAAPPVRRVERELAERLNLPPEQVHAASAAATHGMSQMERGGDHLLAMPLGHVSEGVTCVEYVRITRKGIWELMGFLEELSEAERHDPRLVHELENLDSAAHLAATFAASGRIEVMG